METLAARVKFSIQVSCIHPVLFVENTIGLRFPSKRPLPMKYIYCILAELGKCHEFHRFITRNS